jgi:16S rRNA (guanine966-N2)-methyltransferase
VPSKQTKSAAQQPKAESPPRIIGGALRGRKLIYAGDPRTRPMKDRVREALFNRLANAVKGKHALDLFAGTGALGLEAISRGAAGATLVERHFPTAEIIRQNAAALGVESICTIMPANTLLWPNRWPELPPAPWLVFCSPPYSFYIENAAEMFALLIGLIDRAPAASIFCVEADERFDFNQLPQADQWDVRSYPPAHVGIWSKSAAS